MKINFYQNNKYFDTMYIKEDSNNLDKSEYNSFINRMIERDFLSPISVEIDFGGVATIAYSSYHDLFFAYIDWRDVTNLLPLTRTAYNMPLTFELSLDACRFNTRSIRFNRNFVEYNIIDNSINTDLLSYSNYSDFEFDSATSITYRRINYKCIEGLSRVKWVTSTERLYRRLDEFELDKLNELKPIITELNKSENRFTPFKEILNVVFPEFSSDDAHLTGKLFRYSNPMTDEVEWTKLAHKLIESGKLPSIYTMDLDELDSEDKTSIKPLDDYSNFEEFKAAISLYIDR